MKRTCLLFVLLLALGLTCALAEDEPTVYTCGDYAYILLEDGTAEITAYNGETEKLSIPVELDGYAVTGIGERAFAGCDSLTSITVPRDSYAAQYCQENSLNYTYPDSLDWLLNYPPRPRPYQAGGAFACRKKC